MGAIGVVFGDIGTSVLYAFEEIFSGPNVIDVQTSRAMGAVSMIFWTLTLIVSVKYVLVVMRAANQGEGGIMALTALVSRLHLSPRSLAVLAGLGVFGAALFYGDGMITPAVSVLSAVEGIEVAAPELDHYVEAIALVVLIGLFAAQKFGTSRVGAAWARHARLVCGNLTAWRGEYCADAQCVDGDFSHVRLVVHHRTTHRLPVAGLSRALCHRRRSPLRRYGSLWRPPNPGVMVRRRPQSRCS